LVAKKAITTFCYDLWKASFDMLGKIFDVSSSVAYRWIKQEAIKLLELVVDKQIKEIEFDEMWPESLVVAMLQHANDFIKK